MTRLIPFALCSLLALAAGLCPATEWVDPDTPSDVCGPKSDASGSPLELVFSDEFNVPGRTFQDGHDPRWTAITGFPNSNSQVNAYVDSPAYATTADGMLRLRADASDNSLEYDAQGVSTSATRPYATPMLQSWNKFCFTEGVLEMSGQLPGLSTQGGLWPALWVMGNLGRATAQKSTDKIWPFSYSHCPSEEDKLANQDPSSQQEINACRDEAWTARYGLNPGQGRGAIEIDIVEAMPGTFVFDYKQWKVDSGQCPALPDEEYALLRSPRPMVAMSVQLGPGLPHKSDQRPREVDVHFGGTQRFNCVPDDWQRQWYPELKQGNLQTYGTTYKSQPNVDFWGEYFKWGDIDLQTDSLSSLNMLPHEAYTGQHLYQMDWKAGPDGYVEFKMDGHMQFRVNASIAEREHMVTKGGTPLGTMLSRQIPEEPSYIMFNIDLSTRWGWPDCNPQYCNCCADCRDPKCTTCFYPWQPTVNSRQWLADLCQTLPAYYEIDYVRLWQRPGSTRTSCSPKDYPTQGWIESHRDRYTLTNMNEPLRPVLAGGEPCSSDADCGGSARGICRDAACSCAGDWTGPRCLVRKAGSSLMCTALEDAADGGAACDTDSPLDCGRASGRGRCMEATRPGGKYAPNQTHRLPDGKWQKTGGGDGRCLCNAGWGGATCSTSRASDSCTPHSLPNAAWMASEIESWIETRCKAAQHPDLQKACDDVLWKPHWMIGGRYSTCGTWLRAQWIAKAGSCQHQTTTAPPALCARVGQDCRTSRCCQNASLTCFEKNQWWSECKSQCSPGIDENDAPEYRTPWTCSPLSATSAPTPAPTVAPTPAPTPAGTPAPVDESCALSGQSCLQSRCCRDKSLRCFAKDQWWAECKPQCTPGIDEDDAPQHRTPWSCDLLSTKPAPTPAPIGESCAAVGQSCLQSRCCMDASLTCFEKNQLWGECKAQCIPGVDESDALEHRSPWRCAALSTTAVPTPAPVGESCAASGQGCLQSRCCADVGLACFEKNQWWAECKSQCTPGLDQNDAPEYRTSWTCAVSPCTKGGAVWEADANGYTCGSRIEWLRNNALSTTQEALLEIAMQFPLICGACAPSRRLGSASHPQGLEKSKAKLRGSGKDIGGPFA